MTYRMSIGENSFDPQPPSSARYERPGAPALDLQADGPPHKLGGGDEPAKQADGATSRFLQSAVERCPARVPGRVRRCWSEAEDQRRQPQRPRPAAHRLLPLCTRVRPERARTRAASTSSRRQDRVEPAAEWTTVGSPVYGRLRWSWRVQLRPNTNCARVAAANLTDAGETLSAAQVQFAVEPRDLGRVWRRWEVQGRLGEAAETYETADMRAEALRNSCNARGSRSRPFVQRAGGDVNPSRNSYCQQEE